jgi:hypothetical protein
LVVEVVVQVNNQRVQSAQQVEVVVEWLTSYYQLPQQVLIQLQSDKVVQVVIKQVQVTQNTVKTVELQV